MSRPEPIPTRLYEEARRRLLANAPLLARSVGDVSVLTRYEVQALESVGLTTASWVDGEASDPLQQSIADYMALLETSLTAGEVAKSLHVDVSRVRQRIREHSLFGIEYEGGYRLPRFQFDRRRVLPGLRDVLKALPTALNPLDVAQWFLAPNVDLELADSEKVLSPREWLLRGESVDVVENLARGFE